MKRPGGPEERHESEALPHAVPGDGVASLARDGVHEVAGDPDLAPERDGRARGEHLLAVRDDAEGAVVRRDDEDERDEEGGGERGREPRTDGRRGRHARILGGAGARRGRLSCAA